MAPSLNLLTSSLRFEDWNNIPSQQNGDFSGALKHCYQREVNLYIHWLYSETHDVCNKRQEGEQTKEKKPEKRTKKSTQQLRFGQYDTLNHNLFFSISRDWAFAHFSAFRSSSILIYCDMFSFFFTLFQRLYSIPFDADFPIRLAWETLDVPLSHHTVRP